MILSPRVAQTAELVADGLSNKEIARVMDLSPATVKNHVHTAIVKLGVKRRAGIGRVLAGG